MKKIILLILVLMSSYFGFAQTEDFEALTEPDPVTGVWPLTSGNWLVKDNRLNEPLNWQSNDGTPYAANGGNRAAFVNRENTGAGVYAEEWLITPQFNIAANRQIRFFTRQTLSGDTGTLYRVMVSSNADPANLAAYTTLIEYSETQLSTLTADQLDYEEKVINLTAITGNRFFAFVKIYTQPGAATNGDRWLIDDMKIVERCLEPTTLATNSISSTGATLTWTGTATNYSVEYGLSGFLPGSGTIVTNIPDGGATDSYSIPVGTLIPDECYQFYVTAYCGSGPTGSSSQQTGPFNFCTSPLGSTCAGPIVIDNLPYLTTDTTLQYGNNISSLSPGSSCGATGNYLGGNDVVYSYTVPATTTGTIMIQMNPGTATNTGVFVYSSCANIGVSCIAGVGNASANIRTIPTLAVTAGTTIYIVLSSTTATTSYDYTLTIQDVNCVAPAGLALDSPATTNSANIEWTNGTGGTSTGWEVVVQTAGAGIPQNPGVTVTSPANTSFSAGNALFTSPGQVPAPGALAPDTNYEFWVRADCGNGTFSSWSGPFLFTTLPTCPKPTALTAGVITSSSIAFSWTNPSTATSFEYVAVTCGSSAPNAATDGVDITPVAPQLNQWVIAGLTADTCYDIYIRALCGPGDLSTWSGPLSAATQIVPPACGGTFSDPGGVAGDYANNLDYTVTICPTVPGEKVTVTFTSFNTEANWDGLFIFDGNSTSAPQISSANGAGNVGAPGSYWGTVNPGSFTSTSADGCLTFRFKSDGSGVRAGWTANVTCAPPPACQQPTAFVVGPVTSTTAVLTWVNPGTATSFQVIRLTCGSPVPTVSTPGWVTSSSATGHTFNDLTPDTCYDFYVYGNCGVDGNSLITGPKTATTQVAPPVCGGQFTDLGGATGDYANNLDYTITICPSTPGQVVTVTFTSFNTEANWDGLFIFDGNSTAAPQLSSTNGAGNVGAPGSYWGTVNPGSFTSSSPDGCLTFRFKTDGSGVRAGWTANVTCAPPPTCPKPTQVTATDPTDDAVTVSWVNNSTATVFHVLALPCGSPIPTDTAEDWEVAGPQTTFLYEGLDSATCYDFYVRAVCDNGNDIGPWSTSATQTTQVAPPICGGNFIDEGGISANYPNSSDSIVTICPSTPGEIVTVVFTQFNTEANWDGLYVFDGNSINAPQIASNNPANNVPGGVPGAYWGNTIPGPFTSTSPDGCLTFRFRSDTSVNNPGWVANVICLPPPPCARPILVTASPIFSNSATITWTQPNNPDGSLANAWEIFVVPYQSPVPTTSGIPTSTPTFNANGLQPGTAYTVYVRAICSADEVSEWTAYNFATPPPNDNCATSTFAPVNADLSCVQTVQGTIIGATGSLQPNNCGATSNDDVWYNFMALATSHIISFQNTTTPLNYAVYSGSCDNLTQVACVLDESETVTGLTIGETYYIRVFSVSPQPQFTTNFTLCISTVPCATATPFCTGQVLTYPNATGILPGLGSLGCLGSSPNPAFFFLQVNQAGQLDYLMTQSTTPGGPPTLDVDYAMWGPFTSNELACATVPNDFPVSCSYSPAPTETFSIPNAQLCDIYVVMITNFSDDPGFITFTQTNTTGGGTTACYPYNTFNYTDNAFCQNDPNPSPVLVAGAEAGTYTSTPPGLAIDPVTGTIDLAASTPGNYVVTSTTVPTIGGTCTNIPNIITIRSVTVTAVPDATIAYAETQYCNSITVDQPVTLTGTNTGSYTSTPTGLFLNGGTGAINPGLSTAGVYTITYTVAAAGGCDAFTTTAQVEILLAPDVPYINDVFSCGPYTLPGLTIGDYFTESGGLGMPKFEGDVITETTTLYVYEANEICSDERSFTITINGDVTIDPVSDVTACEPYTLPELTLGNYFNSPGGVDPITDLTIATSQVVYIYAETGTTPNCTGEISFNVNIGPIDAAELEDVIACGSYVLPELPVGNTYYTATGGPTGTGTIITDLTIVDDQTIYIYAQNGDNCTDESDLVVTINETPVLDPVADVNTCGAYTLPTLTTGNYFNAPGGVDPIIDLTLETSQTVYVYAETGTTPNCTAELSFIVNIGSFVADQLVDTTACDSYQLPALSPNNTYYTAPGGPTGTGTVITDLNIVTTQTVYIFAQDGTCTDESDVIITINYTPVLATVSNVTACTSYVLPALTVGNYFNSPNGVDPITDLSLETSQTVYVYAETATNPNCTAEVSFTVTINGTIVADQFNDVQSCGDYTLQALSANNTYYTATGGPNGTGTAITNLTLQNSQTVYVYAQDGTCTDESSFIVTIDAQPVINPIADVQSCGSYALPALTVGNYFSAPGGVTPLTGPITGSQTVYVYAQTGTLPNICTAEQSFVVTINPTVDIAPIADVQACVSYTLPALTVGNYFSQTGGNGPINTANPITTTQTIYVYAQTGSGSATCSDEESFEVVINQAPSFSFTADCEGSQFVIRSVGVSDDASFQWSNAQGVIPGATDSFLVITSPGVYSLSVNSDGCVGEENITVNSVSCVIQKGISPGDGSKNDFFDLAGLNVRKLEIFNRYGTKVYSQANYSREWYGQSDKGDELPDGTYFYVIEREAETKTGWIYINRVK